jgi:hypothetical protein
MKEVLLEHGFLSTRIENWNSRITARTHRHISSHIYKKRKED